MSEMKDNYPKTGLEIAIIGMAGRFPGAKNLDEFWENLKNGVESTSFFSIEELHPEGVEPGLLDNSHYVPASAFLGSIEYFDASFFGYTPTEAQVMDPQMRFFHECAWEALEDAAYDPESYQGLIGLFCGAAENTDWKLKTLLSDDGGSFNGALLTNKGLLSTRISYKLNLKGPSLTVYTACSTSLVAIHLACLSLLSGECDMAIAGGVTIANTDKGGYMFQEGMIQSPDGHCRVFDAAAGGTIFGNGIGVIVLKSLEEALTDADHIYAVIKGSAMNNDGSRKVGYTAPSVHGQTQVIAAAHQVAEVNPLTIGYIEAHGTGTTLGDPIEFKALIKAFNADRKNFCRIGSIKSNIGHLDAAAGVASVIKTAMILNHRLIPPSLHFETPNPQINFENSPFQVNNELYQWESDYPLRAGVSSFGFGGTNVHMILEESPLAGKSVAGVEPMPRPYQLILLSAKTSSALEQITQNLAFHFEKNPDISLGAAAYTLQEGRRAFEYRRMTVAAESREACQILSQPDSPHLHTFLTTAKNPPVIFLFSGQGAQYVNMGRDLYKTEPLFREQMDRCFDILKPIIGYHIKEILYPGISPLSTQGTPGEKIYNKTSAASATPAVDINQTQIAQPLLFVFEYALAKLLMHWGIQPEAMMGHSIGEYVAACLSGVVSLEDALRIVAMRGKLMQQLPGGSMLSLSLSESEVTPLLKEELALAAVNTTSRCVISGSDNAISAFEKDLTARGYEHRRLHTSHAFHSAMMDPILTEFEDEAAQFSWKEPGIPYVSNLTGTWVSDRETTDPQYWANHLRKTVRFADGLQQLLKKKNAVFVEIGPGKTLSTFVNQHQDKKPEHKVINLVRHPREEVSDDYYLLKRIGELWLYDVKTGGDAFYSKEEKHRISLPTYPFEGQYYWIEGDPFKIGAEMMSQRVPLAKKEDLADWFYLPQWKRSIPGPEPEDDQHTHCTWLVFMDACGLGTRLVEQLRKENRDVVTVEIGAAFAQISQHEYVIKPGKEDDYYHLLKGIHAPGNALLQVVHLWSVTREKDSETEIGCEWFQRAQDLGFYSLLHLVRAAARQDFNNIFQITVVSNHLHNITAGEVVCPEKATVMGPVKVIPQEYPGIHCRSIDIHLPIPGPGNPDEERLTRQLLAELKRRRSDKVIAFRDQHRWVQHFESVRLEGFLEDTPTLRQGGVYLVTGGLGGIGILLAQHLAKRVKAKLVLTGRTSLPPRHQWNDWLNTYEEQNSISRKIREIQDLEKSGAEVLPLCADVGNQQQMEDVIAQAEKRFGPINGVIHSAGAPAGENFAMVAEMSKTVYQKQFNSKIYGPVVLAKILEEKELDFCLIMSSLAAVLGGLGFVAYSAANLFLDAFVQKINQGNSGKWISVNWDAWQLQDINPQDTNAALGSNLVQFSLTPAQGLKCFERILSWGKAHHVVLSTGELNARINRWINLESLEGADNIDEKEPATFHARPNLSSPYIEPQDSLQRQIAATWKKLFGMRELGIHDEFFELGGDSLKAMTMTAAIQRDLNVKIPLEQVFKTPTIKGLAEYIGKAETKKHTVIQPAEQKEYYPLSSAQKRIYLMQMLDPQETAYNMPELVPLPREPELHRLEETFSKLIRRHDNLRTSFQLIREEPAQRIHKDVDFKVEYYHLSGTGQKKKDREAIKKIVKDFVRPFDFSRAPFLRAGLIKAGHTGYFLVTDMHHIISDAVSNSVLIEDFTVLYQEEELPATRLQYKDYSEWQHTSRKKASDALTQQENFWLEQFKGEMPRLNFPTDFPRPGVPSYEGSVTPFALTGDETTALKKIAAEQGVTMYMILLALYFVLLAKLSGQEDIVVGTVTAGRRHADLERIIGMFVNTLALRNYPLDDVNFKEFLTQLSQRTLEAFENEDYQFDELVNRLSIKRDIQRNPLFDVMFTHQGSAGPGTEGAGADTFNTSDFYEFGSKFDLVLLAAEKTATLELEFAYRTELFRKETIEKFVEFFKAIVSSVIKNIDIKLKDLKITHERVERKLYIPQQEGDFEF